MTKVKKIAYSYCSEPRSPLQAVGYHVNFASLIKRNMTLGTLGTYTFRHSHLGFTLLEVMISLAIIAIVLVAVFGSQSQGLSLANEAKFTTTAALLAQSKVAEIEALNPDNLVSGSGDFGEDFPGYQWTLSMSDVSLAGTEKATHLKRIDLDLSWKGHDRYQYRLRLYRFVPKSKN